MSGSVLLFMLQRRRARNWVCTTQRADLKACLPYLVVEAGLADAVDVDLVDLAQVGQRGLVGHVAEHANREAGARERVPRDELLRDDSDRLHDSVCKRPGSSVHC